MVHHLTSVISGNAATDDGDDNPGWNLKPSASCKPEYNEQLLLKLNSLVYNPYTIPDFSSFKVFHPKDYGVAARIFASYKNK